MKKHQILLVFLLATIPIIAQQPKENYGRYEFHHIEGGIFILDSQTGRLFQYFVDTTVAPGYVLYQIPYMKLGMKPHLFREDRYKDIQFTVPSAPTTEEIEREKRNNDASFKTYIDSIFPGDKKKKQQNPARKDSSTH